MHISIIILINSLNFYAALRAMTGYEPLHLSRKVGRVTFFFADLQLKRLKIMVVKLRLLPVSYRTKEEIE